VSYYYENPKTKAVVRDSYTAFELQVPVSQRRAMEEILSKVFMNSKANELNFVYYKQRHVHLEVFYKAIQKQRLHEESYRIVAVEGIHPEENFKFEVMLRQKFPEIESILPTSKSTAHNNHGLPIGRYNICVRHQIFPPWQRNFFRNSPVFIFNTYRIMMLNSRRTIKRSGSHQGFQDQMIHQARSHPWIVELPFSLILHPFTKPAKSIGSIA
jgi:hypothetical protein